MQHSKLIHALEVGRPAGTKLSARRSQPDATSYCLLRYASTPNSFATRGSEGHNLAACSTQPNEAYDVGQHRRQRSSRRQRRGPQ